MRCTRLAVSAVLVAPFSAWLVAQSTNAPRPAAPSAPPVSGAPGVVAPPRPADAQKPPPSGSATVRGRILSADSGQPLRQVLVRASAQAFTESTVALTDEDGRYQLRNLPSGRYTITATKGGYVAASHGQRRPGGPGTPLDLTGGADRTGIDFALLRGGVITGTILDEAGDPLAGAEIQLSRARYVDWERTLVTDQRRGPRGTLTDDLGQFRVFGLAPGEYYVSASYGGLWRSNESRAGYSPTFFPGTAVGSQARAIAVDAGTEASGITFALVPARTATISGMVVGPNGTRLPKASVMLSGTSSGAPPTNYAQEARDSTFAFKGLPPGDYRLQLTGAQLDGVNVQAMTSVTVDGADVTGVVLSPARGVAARGRIVFDGALTPPAHEGVRIGVVQVDRTLATSGRAVVADDLSFEVPGIQGGQVQFRASVPEWVLKSVYHNGFDITDTPIAITDRDIDQLEIVFSQRLTDLSGIVVDSRGTPVGEARVVIFADDRDLWRRGTRYVTTARAAADGTFSLRTLPPARYVVVAPAVVEPGEETNPEALDAWRKDGRTVTLREGLSETVRLRVLP